QPGQSIKVVVLKIDHERRKLSLGLKQLQASPWDGAAEKYHSGSVVTGKVTRLMDFGAFVELEPAVEGLIHISELAPQRVRRVGGEGGARGACPNPRPAPGGPPGRGGGPPRPGARARPRGGGNRARTPPPPPPAGAPPGGGAPGPPAAPPPPP